MSTPTTIKKEESTTTSSSNATKPTAKPNGTKPVKKSLVKPPVVQPPPTPNLNQQTPEQMQHELYLLQTLHHPSFAQYPSLLMLQQQQAAAVQQQQLLQMHQQALAAAKLKEAEEAEKPRPKKRSRQEMENGASTAQKKVATPTPQPKKEKPKTPVATIANAPSITLEHALKRIKELEAEVVQLNEQNQQKQNTIQLLTQHNVTLMYQMQMAQQQMTTQFLANATGQTTTTATTPSASTVSTPTVTDTIKSPQSEVSQVSSPQVHHATPQSPQKTVKKVRKLDEVEAAIYVEAIEHIVPTNVENEMKKFFAKVNNGGKRGMLAVHAGDGLDTVAKAVTVALKQVDRLRERALEQQDNAEKCSFCMNLCLQLLSAVTRAVSTGLLTLLDSAISQFMDGTRGQYGIDMANQLETSWKAIFDIIFQEAETSYTTLGTYLDEIMCQNCLEELNTYGKALSYFKMEHLNRMFKVMFTYMKKNRDIEWYLEFCLHIRYYKEYCARMVELGRYRECLDIVLDNILGATQSNRTGSYMDEDKTYLIEYTVLCLRHILQEDIVAQNRAHETGQQIQASVYAQMLEKIMANCINVHPRRVLFPREMIPLLIFILELFPSENAFAPFGDTGQDIRHLTFIADLLFIVVRNIVELDDYDETIDSVKAVGRRIVLECTNSLLEKLIAVKQSVHRTRLKEIIETDPVFKRSLAQICEKAIWIPIHKEEKDYSWKSVNDYLETLQVRQDEHTEPLRRSVLSLLKQLIPSVSEYLERMMGHLNVALNFKIENRNNSSYDEFFAEMKAIGIHYFRSGREKQWEELLSKIFFIHSRKVKLKKMLKHWNADQSNRDGRTWYDPLLEEEEEEMDENDEVEEVEEDEEDEGMVYEEQHEYQS